MKNSEYKYFIKPRAQHKIRSFYRNVARKYRHTYGYNDFMRNVHDAVFSIYNIEKTLPRREPTITRWSGYYMANAGNWYFAYRIEGKIITIVDACHSQNMH